MKAILFEMEQNIVRKSLIFLLGFLSLILVAIFVYVSYLIFQSGKDLTQAFDATDNKQRVVLITQELDTPFWDQVSEGAIHEANKQGLSLEVWGSYGKDQAEFLKQLEIAIYAKMDGIIVQGVDSDAFKELTKVRASFYGIPIISVGSDVPMIESLRRSYVGSDHYTSGKLIAHQLVKDMGRSGHIIVIGDSNEEYYQLERLRGITEALQHFEDIEITYGTTDERPEQVTALVQQMMNEHPNVDGFITLNANMTATMLQEISRRSQVYPYYIYTFDESIDSTQLLDSKKIDGMIAQSPLQMGQKSVELMMSWIRGEVPLNTEGYFTDITMMTWKDARP